MKHFPEIVTGWGRNVGTRITAGTVPTVCIVFQIGTFRYEEPSSEFPVPYFDADMGGEHAISFSIEP